MPIRQVKFDCVIHLYNYFVLIGWQSYESPEDVTIEMSIGEATYASEHVISFREEPSLTRYVFQDEALADIPLRFIALFWIDDGYRLDLRSTPPIGRVSSLGGGPLAAVPIAEVHDRNYDYLIETIERFAIGPAWTDRIVNEIVAEGGEGVQDRFLAQAAFSVDETALVGIAARCRGGRVKPPLEALTLPGLARRLDRTPREYVGPRFAEAFLAGVDAVDPARLDAPVLGQVLRGLRKILGAGRAEALAREAIRCRAGNRVALADLLGETLPPDSRWWVRAMLRDETLGDEQAVSALTAFGVAANASGEMLLGSLALQAALAISGEAPGAALALGWLRLEQGDLLGAAEAFDRLGRHHLHASLGVAWPTLCGAIWPGKPLPPGLFEALNPSGRWPRITVVTPSLDQGDFIEDTILSTLNQGYPNLQHIIVDGGSTDGTAAILARYAGRIEAIMEPDAGQADAINKGFARADGDILAWLNSDDMLAPGALHMAALAHLRTGADIVAGSCIEYAERRFQVVNRPRTGPGVLPLARLADIFHGWFEGEFFFQPETFFTRALFERVGGLDATLHYAMDYDLWLRFAQAGARVEVVGWPFAFFRRHAAQKTATLDDAIEEQARVRARMTPVAPGATRSMQIDRRLGALRRSRRPTVAVLSKRRNKIFSAGAAAELAAHAPAGVRVLFGADERTPGVAEADLVIQLVHVLDDLETLATLRRQRDDRATTAS